MIFSGLGPACAGPRLQGPLAGSTVLLAGNHLRFSSRDQMTVALAHSQLPLPCNVAHSIGQSSILSCSLRLTRACIQYTNS